MHEPNPVA